MKIEFYKKNVYGKELFYVKDEELAIKFHKLLHTVTIQESDMKILSDVFNVEFIQVLN